LDGLETEQRDQQNETIDKLLRCDFCAAIKFVEQKK
jgi:hypothetical protein